ncbi:hypothetical protein ACWDSJ_16105 [Nocardia sp. NPDC003482]
MLYRLNDIDCVSARGHAALGGALAIHAVWRYDRAANIAQLEQFHAALRRGRLRRVVEPARIPAAGDTWSGAGEFAPIEIAPRPIPRVELDAWVAERSRAELRTYGGPAWRLAVVDLDDGGSAVSLLASHTIADGRGFCDALVAAVADEDHEFDWATTDQGPVRRLFADLGATARRIRPVLAAVVLGARLAATGRGEPRPAREDGFELPTVDATIPADLWHAAAKARHGTSTTLAVAVMAALATEVGRVDDQGHARIMMPVSTRTADDERANALGSIDFAVEGVPDDLAPLRALIKEKLSAEQTMPPLIPIAVALPRGLYGELARRAATDPTRTVCSNLGTVDPRILDIDGSAASSITLALINQGLDSRAIVTARGGTLYGVFFEIDGAITLRVNGFHPPALDTTEQLGDLVRRVLARYDLTPVLR